MRLWHKDLIPVLPNKQLLGQWRECVAIASNIKRTGSPNHLLVNKIMNYKLSHFYKYCQMITGEMYSRGYIPHSLSTEKIMEIAPADIQMEADVYITHDDLFMGWHNHRYLMQCLYNLQEKYDCGGVSESEWRRITSKFDMEEK